MEERTQTMGMIYIDAWISQSYWDTRYVMDGTDMDGGWSDKQAWQNDKKKWQKGL